MTRILPSANGVHRCGSHLRSHLLHGVEKSWEVTLAHLRRAPCSYPSLMAF